MRSSTRLRRDNATALESMLAAATDSLEGSDDSRLAGLVVTFRALGETPWVQEPAEPAPQPEAAPAAVGPAEEQLLRVGKLERAEEELREALQRETGEISSLEQETAELRASLEREAGELRAAMADETQALRAALEQAREDAASARELAERAFALAEEAHMEAERRRPRARGASARGAAQAAEPTEPEAPAREPRPGFDDSDQPLAVIALDGRFEQLNPAFERLVGYPEREFRRARWPSLVDSENLIAHRELLVKLSAGDIERAHVDTMYLHAQGLLVPVKGDMELIRKDDQRAGAHAAGGRREELARNLVMADVAVAEALPHVVDHALLQPVSLTVRVGAQHDLVRGEGDQGVLDRQHRIRLARVSRCIDTSLVQPLRALLRDLLGAMDGRVGIRDPEAHLAVQGRGHDQDLRPLGHLRAHGVLDDLR